MSQPSITEGQAPQDERGDEIANRGAAASDIALHAGLGLCLTVGLLFFYTFVYWVHHDLAGSALSGRLAVTLGDSFSAYSAYFPPAERVWFSFAARVSDWTGLRLDLAVVAMTAAMTLFGAGLAYRIRRVTVGATPLFLIMSVAVLTILPILFKNMFGLREPLVALGLWPYLVLRVSDPNGTLVGWRTRVLLGLWLGATLLFKYVYSAVVLLVEAADALVQRRPLILFRIENLIAGGIVALYLFCWLVLDPSQLKVIAGIAGAIDANLADPMTNWLSAARNLFWVIFFLLAYRIFKLPVRVMAIGLALVLGAITAALIQHRWYTHHVFPITLAYIAWWWIAAPHFKGWAHAVMALYLVAPISTQFSAIVVYQESVQELDRALEQAGLSIAGKRVGILTLHPSPYNQLIASHGALRWNASMNNGYVATELESFDKKENALIRPPPVKIDEPGRRMLHDEMLRLWEDMPPDILILDHSYRWPLHHVDVEWTHVFSQDPRFNAVLKRYRPVLAHKGKRLEFKYYVRAD